MKLLNKSEGKQLCIQNMERKWDYFYMQSMQGIQDVFLLRKKRIMLSELKSLVALRISKKKEWDRT